MSYDVAAFAVVVELAEDEAELDADAVSLEDELDDEEDELLSFLLSLLAFAVVSALLFFSRLSVR